MAKLDPTVRKETEYIAAWVIALSQLMEENRLAVNKNLPQYSQISSVELVAQEFEKTPKRSIKRYLYQ